MIRLSRRTYLTLLTGLWASALFWPYPEAGGIVHAPILALTPLWLALTDMIPGRVWTKRVAQATVLYGELAIGWGHAASPDHLIHDIGRALKDLESLQVTQWQHLNAHLAVPLLLAGGWLVWVVTRSASTPSQRFLLWIIGLGVIVLNHLIWGLAGVGPFTVFAILGLLDMGYRHLSTLRLEDGGESPRWPLWLEMAGVSIFTVGLATGVTLPMRHFTLRWQWFNRLTRSIPGPAATAVTGLSLADTNITRSVVPEATPVLLIHSPAPAYWQAGVYTTFNGLSWSNPAGSPTTTLPKSLWTANFGHGVVPTVWHVGVTSLTPTPLEHLVYTGDPVTFSVLTTINPHNETVVSLPTKHYQLVTEVPRYSADQLSIAQIGSIPRSLAPDLTVPGSLSPRVKQLALTITHGAVSPWQAALLIKAYLDQHYRYSYSVTPSQENAVNHFLFGDRRGYCDQFSTTFVMMMRLLGVPARWVVGYAPGIYVPSQKGYLIRAEDAHAWAQIWLGSLGWVAFDPTPGFAGPVQIVHTPPNTAANGSTNGVIPLNRTHPTPAPSSKALPVHPVPLPSPRTATPKTLPHHDRHFAARPIGAQWILFGLGLAGLLAGWQIRRQSASAMAQLWQQILKGTPRYLGHSVQGLTPQGWGRAWLRYFPDDADIVLAVVKIFNAGFYGLHGLSETDIDAVSSRWRELRRRHR
ncbi:MAG: transglutaminase domain-containing protein [Sulfobacillus sp.]|nr:transglutaminase domain-containing protein [Sulfobacillus sp.]